ncbi:hypothetical protein K402DRAFT_421540 [Aulographum hederae CBS 113979]|uniref:Uncharacterized protein n=1 Tax=Aulographum hederae CBS 113979 TaxID=1176131 RepID=A0A6G1GYR2_9PEZI|nr:hypothetical protein K402DRAFT_421540 [Aulographum hederae CBS 113979]
MSMPELDLWAKNRRLPLTPSTVTPPSLSAQTCSSKHPYGMGSTRATQMLNRVASTPSGQSSRHETPNTSPNLSPASSRTASQSSASSRPSSTRHWSMSQSHGGYVSFPDFEVFQSYSDSHVSRGSDRPRDRSRST